MAGMIQEQTKQQINGVPGLMQLPILGALFRAATTSITRTELVVIVTPLCALWAQKLLSRPRRRLADADDPQTVLLERLKRIYGHRRATGRPCPSRAPTLTAIRIHSD